MKKSHLSEELIVQLRKMASGGASIPSMIDEIRHHLGSDDGIVFAVTRYLKEAFFLTIGDVWELGGSKCLGGRIHNDNQINTLLIPAIMRTRKQWDNTSTK